MIPPSLPPSHCHLCGVAENPRASVMLTREAVVGSGTEAAEGQRGKAVTYPLPAALRHLQRQLGYRATLDDALKEAQLVPVTCAWCGSLQAIELWARSAAVLERGLPLELGAATSGMCGGCAEWNRELCISECGVEVADCVETECLEREERA